MDGDGQQTETKPGRYEYAALSFRNHCQPAECAAFREQVKSKCLKLGFDLFQASDLVANIGVNGDTDGLPYRSVETLYEGDGHTQVWRRLASRYNHGLLQWPGQKTVAQPTA